MNYRQALVRGITLVVCLAALVLIASVFGVGFDGVGDARWALMALAGLAATAWFDRPPVVATAVRERPGWGGRLSRSGLLLALTLSAAWLGPRSIDTLPEKLPVEAWLRHDSLGPDWPTIQVHGPLTTRIINETLIGEKNALKRTWVLTPRSALFLRLRHDLPDDEPLLGWAIPPAELRLAGVPADRREKSPWFKHMRSRYLDRISFIEDRPSGGAGRVPDVRRAIAPAPLLSPFPVNGPDGQYYRIAKPFTRDVLFWSAGKESIRAEAGHLLAVDGLPRQIPIGSTALIGLNIGNNQFMPLVPILVDDQNRLTAIRPEQAGDEPVAIDLLGEGPSETGPALFEGWLREARSRGSSAPGLVVVPQQLPWRRSLLGPEVAWSRGTPRPTPRVHELASVWEILLVATAAAVLIYLAWRED